MVQLLIELVPFLFLLMIPVTAFLLLRFFLERNRHRERMTALEKGADPSSALASTNLNRTYLLRGMIWVAAGLSLAVVIFVFAQVAASNRGPAEELEMKLHREKYLKELGASDAQLREVEGKTRRQELIRPGPEALAAIGLVPVAVGIAYLVFFRIEERRLQRNMSRSPE
jgi:hypothetical protein